MPTRTQIQTLTLRFRTHNEKCGTNNGLIPEVIILKQGGAKCFFGRTRYKGKQVSVYIGAFGKKIGQFPTASDGNNEWLKIKNWSRKKGRNANDFKRQEKLELLGQKNLGDGVEGLLKDVEESERNHSQEIQKEFE